MKLYDTSGEIDEQIFGADKYSYDLRGDMASLVS